MFSKSPGNRSLRRQAIDRNLANWINDTSEFPTLSGTPQSSYQNQSQAIWANANQRAVSHTPVQRPQHGIGQVGQQSQQNQTQDSTQNTDLFPSSSRFGGDNYHRSGQAMGQMGSSTQPQPGSIEEFPPLGRNGNNEGQDRRESIMQNSAFGGFSDSDAYSIQPSQRQAPSSEYSRSSTLDRIVSPSIGHGGKSATLYDFGVSLIQDSSIDRAHLS